MRRFFWLLALPLLAPSARAQFVYPKPEDNQHEEGVYREDPFIAEYRRRFFAVFRGDVATFEKAFAEVQQMVRKNPRDARALVWVGNGQTVKAGVLMLRGKKADAKALAQTSRETLDRAVALRPKDPNIYMMRAATLYVQGQYFPADWIPRSNWEKLRDDCERLIAYLGPARMRKMSVHVRGEAYGELGIAYKKLGRPAKAIAAFRKVIELDPGTAYEARARREIAALEAKS